MVVACTSPNYSEQLLKAQSLADTQPRKGIEILRSIDPDTLSHENRHLYDFLTVKLNDKTFVTPTTDSLILKVITEASGKKDEHYAETLYYGGRVYYDLKDYPKALRYFHDAMEALPEESKNKELKGRILSQTGKLLTTLRMYEEAIPVVEESIGLSLENRDTINYYRNMHLLGGIHLRSHNYRMAESIFQQILENSKDKNLNLIVRMDLAQAKYHQNDIMEALPLIRGIYNAVDSVSRPTALAYASLIYLRANLPDTAFMLAKRLIASPADRVNRNIGYYVLLSTPVVSYSSVDSLVRYVTDYAALLERNNNENQRQMSLQEAAYFNYNRHLKENENVRESRDNLRVWLFMAVLIIIILLILFLTFRMNKHKEISTLYRIMGAKGTLSSTQSNATGLNTDDENMDKVDYSLVKEYIFSIADNSTGIRKELQKELVNLAENKMEYSLPEDILVSPVYTTLLEHLEKGKAISDLSDVWDEIDNTVSSFFPGFKSKFDLLTMKKYSASDYQTALLIKLGFSPRQLAVLLGKSKGAIVSRREKLGNLMLGIKIQTKGVDNIIRCL